MIFDLHSHSTLSDGSLTPGELLRRALDHGVGCLAITDHDTVAAYRGLDRKQVDGISLIPGVEFSSCWASLNIHVVGLNIDPDSDALTRAVGQQQEARMNRAAQIAENLRRRGIDGALEGARKFAASDNIGRPHFAQYLIEIGAVVDFGKAFRRYLGRGKAGDVRQFWPTLETVVEWILGAGGTAVLAHPAHYKLSNTRLGLLADEFVAAGGTALEVVSGRQSPDIGRRLADLAAAKSLLASSGSDFHRPGAPWNEVGQASPMPRGCRPVWDSW